MSLSPPPGTPLPPPPPPAQACYRHPNRVTGRACTRCGRPACADCLQPASVGSLCPECSRQGRPSVSTRVKWASAGQHDLTTKVLIAINALVFIGAIAIGHGGVFKESDWHFRGALIARFLPQFGDWYRGVAEGGWWRLVTSGFLHYGIIHLGMNMWVLWAVGPALERELGRIRFLLVYFASMLGGAAGALLLSPDARTAGASGAIFGLFGAFAAGLYQRGVNPLRTSIGTAIILNLVLTFGLSNISVGGHIGGLVAGAICGWFVLRHPSNRMPTWTYLVPVGVAAVAIAIAYWAAYRAPLVG